MKQSFSVKKQEGPAATAADAATEPQAETQPEKAIVAKSTDTQVGRPLPQVDDMQGQFDPDDVRWPRLNLIHKPSKQEAIDAFGIGSIVLNQELKLSDGKTPLPVIAIHFAKDLIQKLPFGDAEKPKVFKTEQEVIDAGGSLRYEDVDSGNYFMRRGHIQLLIPKPEGVDDALFPYEFQGQAYAMALLTVSSSAYTSAGKAINTLRASNKVMRQGLRYGRLNLTSEPRKNAKFSWIVPVIKFAGANPPELVEFIDGLR